jgi:glycosyltransferase involved in cell wall biosynthesis
VFNTGNTRGSTLDAFVLVAEPAGCPNASLEALGADLPVLATDVGGIREQLGDGAAGSCRGTTRPAPAAAMADVARRPELRKALANAGQARAAERFGLAVMADRYARLPGLTPPEGSEGAGGS